MIKIINVISSKAKFPLSYIKGSEIQRFEKAKNLTNQVFYNMRNNCGQNWNTKQLNEAIKKYTDRFDINIIIENENNSNYFGSIEEIISVHSYKNSFEYIMRNFGKMNIPILNEPFTLARIDGYKLYIRTNNEKIENKYAVIHEVRHLFDHLCNPKIIGLLRRNIMVAAPKEQSKAYNDIYEMFLDYKKYPNFEPKEILKKLDIIPNYKKINILQGIRNTIKTEVNAYSQELREQCKEPFTEIIDILNIVLNLHMDAKYSTKMKFINKLLKDCIKTERLNNI